MATYKLIQDIEAEDKILGPLTLRQFVFGMVAAFFYYLCFYFVKSGMPYFLALVVPPALLLTFFAFPFGRDQPTEVWAVAKFNYLFKSRNRIWNQSGVKNLVTITAPKKVQRIYTDGLSPIEVTSRLSALADTLDSRGWAVKNINLNTYTVPMAMPRSSDRLIDLSRIPNSVSETDISSHDDILDMQNSPIAQQFSTMISQAETVRRQQAQQQVSGSATGANSGQPATNNYWFMNNSSQATPLQMAPQAASISPQQDAAISEGLKQKAHETPAAFTNLRTLKKPAAQGSNPHSTTQKASAKSTPVPPVTAPADPAILSLADNNDLNVSTLAREAKRAKGQDDDKKGEVVVSLR